ncbi:MAG: Gfo/Idh/MocA family oxidoreductase [Oscillospiraceae bacterium]|jgi:predicted dehydrogenase|nr:Gfo/Idh/MocA family oxidoreductase [Oscillospiraceae bacterium]
MPQIYKPSESPVENKKLRVGVIGTGGIAHAHMKAYLNQKDVEIVGASDIVPGKARAFLDEFGLTDAPDFEDNDKLLALKPDGVSVCTYNTTHHTCAVAAMKAGVHVLCEKPMSVTLDQAIQMARAQKETGKILTIGFQPRYDPNMKMIKDIVRSGELGDIYYVQTGGGRRRGIPGGTFIKKELAGVGCLADIGCYGLDMALNTVGYRKPVTVSATASDRFGKNPKYFNDAETFSVDDFSCALIRFEDGLVLDFRMSWAMHMDTMGDTLFLGTDAGLKVKSPNPHLNWGGAWDGSIGDVFLYKDLCGNQVEIKVPLKSAEKSNNFESKVRDFLDAIISGGPSPIPWQEIIYNQAIIDGIIRSSEAKREVEIVIPEI